MKTRVLCELKRSSLMLLWLLLVQTTSALFSGIAMLVLELLTFGGIHLAGPTPLWEWIAGGVLSCLFWLAMGRFAPPDVRPGPVGAVIVLTMWAILTSLMWNIVYLLLLAQKTCGWMLEQILQSLGYESWNDERVTLIAYFLLPAALGMGLLWGRKRTAAAGQDG